jgi:hypothetical protein
MQAYSYRPTATPGALLDEIFDVVINGEAYGEATVYPLPNRTHCALFHELGGRAAQALVKVEPAATRVFIRNDATLIIRKEYQSRR